MLSPILFPSGKKGLHEICGILHRLLYGSYVAMPTSDSLLYGLKF